MPITDLNRRIAEIDEALRQAAADAEKKWAEWEDADADEASARDRWSDAQNAGATRQAIDAAWRNWQDAKNKRDKILKRYQRVKAFEKELKNAKENLKDQLYREQGLQRTFKEFLNGGGGGSGGAGASGWFDGLLGRAGGGRVIGFSPGVSGNGGSPGGGGLGGGTPNRGEFDSGGARGSTGGGNPAPSGGTPAGGPGTAPAPASGGGQTPQGAGTQGGGSGASAPASGRKEPTSSGKGGEEQRSREDSRAGTRSNRQSTRQGGGQTPNPDANSDRRRIGLDPFGDALAFRDLRFRAGFFSPPQGPSLAFTSDSGDERDADVSAFDPSLVDPLAPHVSPAGEDYQGRRFYPPRRHTGEGPMRSQYVEALYGDDGTVSEWVTPGAPGDLPADPGGGTDPQARVAAVSGGVRAATLLAPTASRVSTPGR